MAINLQIYMIFIHGTILNVIYNLEVIVYFVRINCILVGIVNEGGDVREGLCNVRIIRIFGGLVFVIRLSDRMCPE